MNDPNGLEVLVAEQAAELDVLREANAQLTIDKARLEKVAMTDPLTGLWNRRYARHELARLLSGSRRQVERGAGQRRRATPPYTVLMLDIDHFKKVNDTFGHDVGDDVIRAVTEVMRETCREADALVRWGGEEFLIVCYDTTQREALELAHRLRQAVEEADFGLDVPVTVSIGVSQPSSLDEDYEVVIKRADMALYAAKRAGRNGVAQLYAETAA